MTSIDESPAGTAVHHPLERDLPCYQCGYNLRGLSPAGGCPECSAPIAETLRRHAELIAGRFQPLITSDPRWVSTLSRACALVVLAGLMTIVAQTVSLFERGTLPAAIRFPMFMLPLALFAVGAWLAGAREPVFAQARGSWPRIALRAGTAAWAICIALLIAGIVGASGSSILLALRIAVVVAGIASWSFFWRFRDIALRLDRPDLRRASNWLAWLTLATCLMTLLPDMDGVRVRPSHTYLVTAVPVAGMPMLLGLLPFSLVTWPRVEPALVGWLAAATVSAGTLVIVELFRRALRRAAKTASIGLAASRNPDAEGD